METVERKDASTGLDEPIKSELLAPSSDAANDRNNSTASPPPNCSICLEKLINTSFTDSCLHQFCFTCLLQWSKIKTECPLCKQTFKSIIHNVRSEQDYDQYHVQYTSQVAATLDVTADIHISGQWNLGVPMELGVPVRPFMYRTTMGANRRYGMLLNPEAVERREQIPSTAPQISHEERRQRNSNPIDYRRTVYRHGVWAALLPDAFGRFRECSAEYYRQHPSEVDRLVPWLNRELQVLLNDNRPHIAYVLNIITEAITQHDIASLAFLNIVRPFFGAHSDHFIHELLNYARTNFDLVGYDQSVSYIPRRGLSNQYLPRIISPASSSSSISSSSDPDVRVLNDNVNSHRNNSLHVMPSIGPHVIDVAGSSTVGQAFRIQLPYYTGHTDVLTISSSSSSSENECEIIGYVKPRHEKTPEIIDISSDGEGNTASQTTSNDNTQSEALVPTKTENLPSTSSSGDQNNSRRTRRRTEDAMTAQMYKYLSTTSESDTEETDSDYNPRNTKSRYHKSTSKKTSKVVSRKSHTRKRKKLTDMRKKSKETRSRLPYYSCSDNEISEKQTRSCSRGTKRYLSKSSDDTDSEKIKKKNKKNKKTKSSKKDKKRHVTSSSSSKASRRIYSSSYSSESNSDCEVKNKKSRRRTKKCSTTSNAYHYYSEEEPSTSTKSSSKSSSTRTSARKTTNKFSESYISNYRSPLFTRSSTDSLDSRKDRESLQDVEIDSRRDSDDNTKENERSRSCCSSSTFFDDTSSYLKRKESSKSTVNTKTRSHSYDRLSSTTTTSGSSSQNNASSPNEHSVSLELRKDRRRSHKKHKESKKRRRSYS